MAERVTSLIDNDLQLIRNSVEKLTIQSDLRRKLIGGISEEDVAKYIDSVRQQFQLNEDELKQNIKVLQSSNDEMRREFDRYSQKFLEEKAKLQEDLEKALADSSVYKKKCSEMDEIIKEIDARYDSEVNGLVNENQQLESKCDGLSKQLLTFEAKVEELQEQLQESRKIGEEYSEACKTMEQQLKSEHENNERALEEKANLNSRVVGFKSEIEAIFKQLNTLNEQVIIDDDSKQQLELERLRADKAEKELSQFGECVSGLKDRFHKNQKQLEARFIEIEEMQKVIHTDINGLRTNLDNFCVDIGTEIDNLCSVL